MIQGDSTGKASSSAFNKLRFGITRVGGHTTTWTDTLIPAETESEAAYTQAYKVSNKALRALLDLSVCECSECESCTILGEIQNHPLVRACMVGPPYKDHKELPVSKVLGDGHSGWLNFVRKILKIAANLCNTHATAIGAQNGTQRAHFTDDTIYDKWYSYVCRIKDIAFEEPGHHVQTMLHDWLMLQDQEEAAVWQSQWWGGARGRWLLGNGGIACVAHNQGLEASWHWDREEICGGRQVWENKGGVWENKGGVWENKEGGMGK